MAMFRSAFQGLLVMLATIVVFSPAAFAQMPPPETPPTMAQPSGTTVPAGVGLNVSGTAKENRPLRIDVSHVTGNPPQTGRFSVFKTSNGTGAYSADSGSFPPGMLSIRVFDLATGQMIGKTFAVVQ